MSKSKKIKIAKKYIFIGVAAIIFIALAGFLIFLRGKGIQTPSLPKIVEEQLKPDATITVISDKVTIERDGETIELTSQKYETLKLKDKIITDNEGVASIIYKSGTIIRISHNTEIVYEDADTLSQNIGLIFVRFKKLLGFQESFEIESQNMVASVRGTAFASEIKPNKDPKIIVMDHEVEVQAKDDKTGERLEKTKKLVKTGEQGQISKIRKTVSVTKQALTQEELNWIKFNEEADKLTAEEQEKALELFRKFATASATPKPTPTGTPKPTPTPISYLGTMPGLGYTRSRIKTDVGEFSLACYGSSLGATRVITDSANETDCKTDCPVMPLADYAIRNNGIAAMNGMYFCPADYPSCADKKNSFDTLFFNSRVKRYINSDNNVYSTIPFLGVEANGVPKFVAQSLSWGRDTGIQAGTAGNPLLVSGGSIAFSEAGLEDRQRTIKANRGAFVQEADKIYLCIVEAATVQDSAKVYLTLGADNAINIDGGGSSALWVSGAYKYGPGRNIPTAIIFAK